LGTLTTTRDAFGNLSHFIFRIERKNCLIFSFISVSKNLNPLLLRSLFQEKQTLCFIFVLQICRYSMSLESRSILTFFTMATDPISESRITRPFVTPPATSQQKAIRQWLNNNACAGTPLAPNLEVSSSHLATSLGESYHRSLSECFGGNPIAPEGKLCFQISPMMDSSPQCRIGWKQIIDMCTAALVRAEPRDRLQAVMNTGVTNEIEKSTFLRIDC